MKGRLSYEQNETYLAECECGTTLKYHTNSFDKAEQFARDERWEITKSDCVGLPYAKCGVCMARLEREHFEHLLKTDVPPVKLGNENKTGECGMSGIKVDNLYPHRVGQVDFMICGNCKSIMNI